MPTTLPSMPNTSLPSVDNAVLAPSPSGHANGHYGEHAGGGGAGAEGAGNGHDAGAGAGDAWGGAAQPRAKAEEEEVKMVVGAGLEPGSGPGPGQKAHSPAKAAQKGGKKRSSDKAGSKRKKGKGTLLQPPGPDVNWNDHSACTVALRRAQGFVPYCHWTFPTQSVEDIHPSYMMAKRIARGRHPPAGEGQAAELGSRLTTRLPPVKVTQPLDDLPRPLPYDDDMTPEQIKEKSMVNRVVTVPRSAHPERYYYVLHYIIDMDWCHLVPLQPTGVFTGTSFRAGRPRHPPRPSSSGDERSSYTGLHPQTPPAFFTHALFPPAPSPRPHPLPHPPLHDPPPPTRTLPTLHVLQPCPSQRRLPSRLSPPLPPSAISSVTAPSRTRCVAMEESEGCG